MMPPWFHVLSIAWLLLGAACALFIAADEWRHPRRMAIMNVVWPVTALFGTGWTCGSTLIHGRSTVDREPPFFMAVANAPCTAVPAAPWAISAPSGWSLRFPPSWLRSAGVRFRHGLSGELLRIGIKEPM